MWQRIVSMLIAILAVASSAHAAFDEELLALQQRWVIARYRVSGDESRNLLKKLVIDIDKLKKKYNDNVHSYIWSGVIRSSLAEAINGVGALGVVKEAKTDLEKAILIDPKAEGSYAYGALGLMYAKIPGWPIGFGDDKKAQEMLKKGVEISPNSMIANFYYANYLFDKADYRQAKVYIEKAEQATPPAPSEIWNNRRGEIRELAEKIQQKLK